MDKEEGLTFKENNCQNFELTNTYTNFPKDASSEHRKEQATVTKIGTFDDKHYK